jgi:histidinol dehydrogenase
MIRIIRSAEDGFEKEFSRIKNRGKVADRETNSRVLDIIENVRTRGNDALFMYAEKFDRVSVNAANVEVKAHEIDEALSRVDAKDLEVLKYAAARIEAYHEKQGIPSWSYSTDGVELGQRIVPLARVGVYAPGGRAPYPSTVLMASIPARIAGVKEIVLVTPPGGGTINPLILAAAKLAGVNRVFRIGGAHAIAALAYGTESIPAVDKIVGPGNIYVAVAKKLVYGQVGIDMIAGPSEILILCEGGADPAVVAADLLSQAEHDELASAILLTPDNEFGGRVALEVTRQLKELSRESIAAEAIREYGAVIVTRDMDEAVKLANRFAPEHLELMVHNPEEILGKIESAGAVFLGLNTPEALGDYIAGPNHILPTAGTARFSSPLGVYDFVKRMSIEKFSLEALGKHGEWAARFARMEGLSAHERSVRIRLKAKTP